MGLGKLVKFVLELFRVDIYLNQITSERKKQYLRSQTTSHKEVIFTNECQILNHQNDPQKIVIGEKTLVRGILNVFPNNGQIYIGDYCFIGENSNIWSQEAIKIGNYVLISHNVNIIDTNSHEIDSDERITWIKHFMDQGHTNTKGNVQTTPITIENNAWINFNAIILKGVTIGEGAIVAAGAVVTKNVPPYAVVAGNPAIVVKMLK